MRPDTDSSDSFPYRSGGSNSAYCSSPPSALSVLHPSYPELPVLPTASVPACLSQVLTESQVNSKENDNPHRQSSSPGYHPVKIPDT